MDTKDNKTIHIPMGNTKEDIKEREAICLYAGDAPRVDRHWSCENDGRRKADRREGAVLHNSDRGIKKEIDRLARSNGHHQILDDNGLFPY